MTRKELTAALRAQTEGVRMSPQLRRGIIDAVYGKEQKIMKRKIPAIVLAVALSILCCAAALAAADRAGMLDFLGQYDNTPVPEGMQNVIENDVLETGSDLVDVTVRELYYDGLTARMTIDVKPKSEKIMLIGFDALVTDAWSDQNRLNPAFDPSDARTVQEVFREKGYTAGYTVSASLTAPEGEIIGGSRDCTLSEDGVLTLFLEEHFTQNVEARGNVTMCVTLRPSIDADGNAINANDDQRMRIDQPLALSSTVGAREVYVSEAPVVLEKTGVTIEHFFVDVQPAELYATLIYTITETELGSQHPYGKPEYGTLDQYFLLELIDPDSTSEDPYEQTLTRGLSDTGTGLRISAEGEEPARYMSTYSLALSELRDSYTVRVFDFATKERYESAALSMRKATAEDVAIIDAAAK